jgi:hypothetical protein
MERSEIRGGIDASWQSRIMLRSIQATLAGVFSLRLDTLRSHTFVARHAKPLQIAVVFLLRYNSWD